MSSVIESGKLCKSPSGSEFCLTLNMKKIWFKPKGYRVIEKENRYVPQYLNVFSKWKNFVHYVYLETTECAEKYIYSFTKRDEAIKFVKEYSLSRNRLGDDRANVVWQHQ